MDYSQKSVFVQPDKEVDRDDLKIFIYNLTQGCLHLFARSKDLNALLYLNKPLLFDDDSFISHVQYIKFKSIHQLNSYVHAYQIK